MNTVEGGQVPGMLDAAVCFGAVMHERHTRAHNRFVYPTAFLRLPLSRIDALRVPLLGIGRRNVFSFLARDHGRRDGSPLMPWLREILNHHGPDAVCDGEVVLHTMPRVFGYVFNPVSFWLCEGADGSLRAVIAEVTNTFGDRHSYLCAHDDQRPILRDDTLRAQKIFHVSPFQKIAGGYEFRFDIRPDRVGIWIDYSAGNGGLIATLTGPRKPLTNRAILGACLRRPLGSRRVLGLIHWQALKLWWKGARYNPRPAPPVEEVTR